MQRNKDSLDSRLEEAINCGNLKGIEGIIYEITKEGRIVEVQPIERCLLHPFQNDFFPLDELYFCPLRHKFCLDCIRNRFFEHYSAYGPNIEYCCPKCVNGLFYHPSDKEYFIYTVFGFVNQIYINVDDSQSDFNKIATEFYGRSVNKKSYKVMEIFEVRNPVLEYRYEIKKSEILKYSKNVMTVWHGTPSKDIYDMICKEGFKIGGKEVDAINGNAYGIGVNTGIEAITCLSYTNECGYLLMCEGVLGNDAKLPKDLQTPEKNVHSFKGANVIVFANKDQVLPKYLLRIQRLN